jgi:NTE family protein
LVLEETLAVDARAVSALLRGLIAHPPSGGRGALLDTSGFRRLLDGIPFERIEANLAVDRLLGVTVSATHVASGRTAVFAARASDRPLDLGVDPTVVAHDVSLRPPHVLASAAIPVLFPAVAVDGELYCDGGLRQLVPLRPALRLGARSLIVVSPRSAPSPIGAAVAERAYSSPLYLLGKALDALLLDHVDADVERLEQMNALLAAGQRAFGPRFESELAAAMPAETPHELHEIASAVLRPSENLGCLAAEHVRSKAFAGRRCTPAKQLVRRLADSEGAIETDLVSYLLFDGEYAGHLLELGMADARARDAELRALVAGASHQVRESMKVAAKPVLAP